MTDRELELLRAAGFVLALALALGWQRWRPHALVRTRRGANAGLWAINLIVLGAVCGGCAFGVARWSAAAGIGLLNWTAPPVWLGIAVTVLVLDGVSYAWHRANHRFRPLWRFHQVHHSDTAFSVSTAVRFHPGELLLSLPLRLGAIVALGAPAVAVLVFELLFTLSNFVEHGDIDLPVGLERRLSAVFVTPALHRRHHSPRRAELDSNFATVFSFWDRLGRSFGPSTSADRFDAGLPDLRPSPPLAQALALPRRVYLPG
jgi:sterol desaturase/sphingolipid hydroxylase (fatty acid hydroxylase superfamily)